MRRFWNNIYAQNQKIGKPNNFKKLGAIKALLWVLKFMVGMLIRKYRYFVPNMFDLLRLK